jgi:hypothetical protein
MGAILLLENAQEELVRRTVLVVIETIIGHWPVY